MKYKVNNPFKPVSSWLGLVTRVVIGVVMVLIVLGTIVMGVIEANDPTIKAAARADVLIREQNDSDLRWCLRESNGDKEVQADCKRKFVEQSTK